MMGERRHLNHDEMFKAIGIIESGRTQADAARALHTGRGVISRMWSRYEQFGSPEERHQGKQRVTTAGQDRFLSLRALRERNSTVTMLRGALQNVSNIIVSTQTVRNRLHESGLHACRPVRSPAICHGNRARRVLWCQQHQNWTVDQWRQVLFTDESCFGCTQIQEECLYGDYQVTQKGLGTCRRSINFKARLSWSGQE